ncbi:MAG: hypothetical protein KDD39_07775 [Bdellovibrionales bacterium]|nr:hypothetical protein [Bdellovibrionales bacterium]
MRKVSKFQYVQCRVTALALTLVLLGGCALDNRGEPALAGASGIGVLAFRGSVYTVTGTRCVTCHSLGGQYPNIAAEDVTKAYAGARTYTNFSNVDASVLVRKTMDGHCGGACSSDGSEMAALVQKWWEDGESRLAQLADGIVLPAQDIPTDLSQSDFTVMQWSLDDVLPGGGVFELSLKRDLSGEGLIFSMPRIVSSRSVHVKSLEIGLDGALAGPGTYSTLDRTVNAGTEAVLSSSSGILLASGSDHQITPIFTELNESSSVSCTQLSKFVASAKPQLSNSCFGCHRGNNFDATSRFDMRGTDAELCDASLMRLDWDANNSPLIQYPLNGINGHPLRPSGFNQTRASAILEWVNDELNAQ